jgi:Protein of unknown function (DUF3300)
MYVRSLIPVLALLAAAPAVSLSVPASAQETAAITDGKFSKEELDQILAPIALYPDDLLSNVLIAATYPLEVVQAARWIEEPEHADLKGDALVKALDKEDWDPSVKALTQFPDVLAMMSEQLDWTQKLGDAFIASEAAVMDRVQFLRDKAEEAGNLKSNKHRTVTTKSVGGDDYIYIEPAEPEIVYVPVYDPYVVYGSWWYPDYPPYYWEYDNVVYVNDYYWGAGIVIAPSLWAWSRPRWHDHYIHVDRRRYNRLARHKWKHKSDRWRHDARHRRGVKFKDAKAWRKSWDPKHKGPHIRARHRDDDKKYVRKPGGGNRFEARRKQGPKPQIEGKKRHNSGPPKAHLRKHGDQPRALKRGFKPEKSKSFGSKKHIGKKKGSSAGKTRPHKKSISKSKKRSSARKSSHKRKSSKAHRKGGRKAAAHHRRGGHKAHAHRGGGHKARAHHGGRKARAHHRSGGKRGGGGRGRGRR